MAVVWCEIYFDFSVSKEFARTLFDVTILTTCVFDNSAAGVCECGIQCKKFILRREQVKLDP